MANTKSNTARRREVRRNVPKPTPKLVRHLRRKEVGWAALFAICFAIVTAFFAIGAREHPTYRVNQLITRPVVSPVAFTAIDIDTTEQNRQRAREGEPAVYVPNLDYLGKLRDNFGKLISLAQYASIDDVPAEDREQADLSEAGLNNLRKYVGRDGQPTPQWNVNVTRFLDGLFELAIITPQNYAKEKSLYGADRIIIIPPDESGERIRNGNVLISTDNHEKVREEIGFQATKAAFAEALQPSVVKLVMHNIEPTYLFDPDISGQRQQAAYNAEPIVEMPFEANQVVVSAGTSLTEAEVDLLNQMHAAERDTLGPANLWLSRAGMFTTLLLIIGGAWVYIFAYNDRIPRNPLRGLIITILLTGCQGAAVLSCQIWPQFTALNVTFYTLLTAMVLAIVYDQRFALAIGSILALVMLVSVQLPIATGLVLFVGVAVAALQLRDVRTRSKLVLTGLLTGVAMAATVFVVGLATRPLYLPGQYTRIGIDAFMVVGSGFLVGLFVQGILPIIEKVFHVTTAMTLRELNDAAHPLLKRLAEEAPGTYQHSLRIADMAEAAADAIGADGLACRVGAMYHDVGKINKPSYFIENQGGGPNRHEKLSPAMSLLIIVGHVKDGIEMAREYGLPKVIRHFIESHHGTTLVEYFYHAAKKASEGEDKPLPSEFEFRYPGPKPGSKEAAIMLLCDGLEAAARSLPDPTPVRLEQLVTNIANKRLMDDQFSESNLTLSDLHRIEQAITKTLCAIYHSRIKYPTDKDADAPGTEQEEDAA